MSVNGHDPEDLPSSDPRYWERVSDYRNEEVEISPWLAALVVVFVLATAALFLG